MYKETDYFNVALQQQRKTLMERFWADNAAKKIWVSASTGEEIPFKELDDDHLKTIIRMLVRFNSKNCDPMLRGLLQEAITRKLI